MIGLIITGHGMFGTGMYEALKSIVGNKEEIYSLNFHNNKSVDMYKYKLQVLIDDLLTRNDSVIVMVDLSEGITYDAAREVCTYNEKVGMVSSVNLNMLLTMVSAREVINDPYELLNLALIDYQNVTVSYNTYEYSPKDDSKVI